MGFQVAEFGPPVWPDHPAAVRGVLQNRTGLRDEGPTPVPARTGPEAYVMLLLGMVSAPEPEPVVKLVLDTTLTQLPENGPRSSMTVTGPSWPETPVVPEVTVPSAEIAGTLMESPPSGAMTRVTGLVALWLLASVTRTVNGNVPAGGGAGEQAGGGVRVSPAAGCRG